MEAVESAMGLGIVLKVKDMASNQFGRIRDEMAATKDGANDLIKSFDASMKKMAMGLGMVATGAGLLAATFVKPISMAMQSQYKMAEVNTLLGRNQEALMSRLGDQSSELAMKFGKSGAEMSSAMYTLISSGVDAEKVGGVLETVGKLAIGGMTDMATASDGLTSMMNAFGVAAENSEMVADSMFVAAKRGKTTIGEISNSIGQVAPIAAKVGLSIDETLSSIAAATLSGIRTAEAVTGQKALLSAIMQPTEQAKKMAAELGIQFDEEALKTKGLRGMLDTLMIATDGSTDKMGALLGSVVAVNFAFAIMKDNGGVWASITDDMKNKSGAANEAFSIVADTFLFKWNTIKQAFTVGIKRFGAVFLPIMGVILTPLGLLAKAFANIPKPILTVIGVIIALGSAFVIARGLTLAAAAAMKLWSIGAKSSFVSSAMSAKNVLFGLNLQFLRSAMYMTGQIAVVYALYKAYESNFGGIKTAVSWISAAWDVAMDANEDGTAKIKKSMLKGLGFDDTNMADGIAILTRIGSIFFRLKMFVVEFGRGFQNEFSYIIKILDEFGQKILGIGDNAFTDMIKSLLNIDKSSLQEWRDWGKTIGMVLFYVVAIIAPIMALVKTIGMVSAVMKSVSMVMSVLTSPVGLVVAAIAALAMAGYMIYKNWDTIGPMFENVWNMVSGAFTTAWNILQPAIEQLKIAFGQIMDAGSAIWSILGPFLTQFFLGLAEIVGGVLAITIIGAFIGIVTAVSSAAEMIATIVSGLIGIFSGIIAFITGVFTGNWEQAWNGVVQIFQSIFEMIWNIGKNVLDGITDKISAVANAIGFAKSSEPTMPKLKGYATGGYVSMPQIAMIAERGPEIIMPMTDPSRAIPLWQLAGQQLGMFNEPDAEPVTERPSMMNLLTERFSSTRETNTIEKTSNDNGQPTVIENVVYLDGEQVYRSVKRHDRYDRLRGGDDSAE